MRRHATFLLLPLLVVPTIASGQSSTNSCPCDTPLVRAGMFSANGSVDSANRTERITALASELPQLVQDESLDVLCLNELWDPTLRSQALQAFLNDPDWYVYEPAPVDQPECRSACYNRPLDFDHNPINLWVRKCSFTTVPGTNASCSEQSDDLGYVDCIKYFCPELLDYVAPRNPNCRYCIEDAVASESIAGRVDRCTLNYTSDLANCDLGFDGESGATLVSRYPLSETEYHPLSMPASSVQPGITNNGIAYAKVAAPTGSVHVFCAHLATASRGMDANEAQTLNATQSQEVVDYITSKADREPAVFLSGTSSGPALTAAPSGAVNAAWPDNFDVLRGELSDALMSNLDGNGQLMSVADCTFGCDAADPVYVDHIMTSGGVCHRNGGLVFTTTTVDTGGGPVPLSDHYGVRTDVCYDLDRNVSLPGSMMLLRDRGDPSKRRSVFRMSDPSIDLTGVDPRITGATLYIGREGAGSPIEVEMPAAGWTKAAGATEYRFRSRTGPVSLARLREGMLIRIGLKGSGAYPLAVPQGSVGAILQVGDTRFCTAFGGKVLRDNGSMFLAIRSPARTNCPVL